MLTETCEINPMLEKLQLLEKFQTKNTILLESLMNKNLFLEQHDLMPANLKQSRFNATKREVGNIMEKVCFALL